MSSAADGTRAKAKPQANTGSTRHMPRNFGLRLWRSSPRNWSGYTKEMRKILKPGRLKVLSNSRVNNVPIGLV